MLKRSFSPPPPHRGYIGHRGVAAFAPENTLASFEMAAKLGINWVEFDVRLSHDNHLIIFHDDELDRTTNGTGLVFEKPLSYLANLDAGSWFNPSFKAQKIPVFTDILPILIKLNLFLNIELKLPDNPTVLEGKSLFLAFSKVLDNWPANAPWPLLSSFYWPILDAIRECYPQIPLGYLSESCSAQMIEQIAHIDNAALHCHYETLSPELFALAQNYSLPLLVYTVNNPEMAQALMAQGAFGIFSDNGGLDHSMLI